MSDALFEEGPTAQPPAAAAPAPTPMMEVEFEDSHPASSGPAVPAAPPVVLDAETKAAYAQAVQCIASAGAQRQQIDLWAIALAGFCGQGLASVTRIKDWTGGHGVGLLATAGGIGLTAWMWTQARAPTQELEALPSPAEPGLPTTSFRPVRRSKAGLTSR